jgi:phosphodiesterase/alkaline phosphatase D-like protein
MTSQSDAALVVGLLLRWVDETSATVWVETSRACEVSVLRQSQPTFSVTGHHYALVVVRGLQPGTRYPYEVHLDGRLVWPPPDVEQPASVIVTRSSNQGLRLAFGSCRVAGPRDMPLGIDRLLRRYDPDLDALVAFAERLQRLDHAEWPDLLLLMGDQVYADDVPRATRRAMVDRRGGDVPESPSVSDFEDYTRLYLDSWTQPTLRWLYSTLSSAMIFDDHELVDNWDISAAWVAERRASPGWDARLSGALMSYWIYQHLGNLSPDDLASDRLYQGVLRDGDGSERLRTHVREYDSDHSGSRWAYRRDFDDIRLLVLDTRAARVLEEGQRDMLDPAEWRWLEDNITGARHLLIASSVPVVYALGFHQLQAWSERLAAGLWGLWYTHRDGRI